MAFDDMGVLQDAGAGAAAGAMFGPWGALIGGIAGAAYGIFEGGKQAKLRKEAFQEQVKQEELRKQQMENQYFNETRKNIRATQAAAATGEANQAAAGAETGIAGRTGSAVGGSRGGIQGQSGQNALAMWENVQTGRALFESNLKEGYKLNEANATQGRASLGLAAAKMGETTGKAIAQLTASSPSTGPSIDQQKDQDYQMFQQITSDQTQGFNFNSQNLFT